jgi:hypothetical protein
VSNSHPKWPRPSGGLRGLGERGPGPGAAGIRIQLASLPILETRRHSRRSRLTRNQNGRTTLIVHGLSKPRCAGTTARVIQSGSSAGRDRAECSLCALVRACRCHRRLCRHLCVLFRLNPAGPGRKRASGDCRFQVNKKRAACYCGPFAWGTRGPGLAVREGTGGPGPGAAIRGVPARETNTASASFRLGGRGRPLFHSIKAANVSAAPVHPRNKCMRAFAPLWSRTTKQASCSSTDQGWGKRRAGIGVLFTTDVPA